MFNQITNNFIHIISEMETKCKQENEGIYSEDGYYGIPKLNIPFEYTKIQTDKKYIFCYTDNDVFLYDNEGHQLLKNKYQIKYLNNDLFFVQENKDEYSALYLFGIKLTNYIFKSLGYFSTVKFNDNNYCHCYTKDEEVIINGIGEIVYSGKKSYESKLSLYGKCVQDYNKIINIETKEILCENEYGFTHSNILNINTHLFIKLSDSCVSIINYIEGTVQFQGEPPIIKKKVESIPTSKELFTITNKEQNRNDLCECGSGKKYKKCCINNIK